MSIETLIANNTSRANTYADKAAGDANELKDYVKQLQSQVVEALDSFGISSDIDTLLPEFSKPSPDGTASPTYDNPTAEIPAAPTLKGVSTAGIDAIRFPNEPILNESKINSLFSHGLPSSTLPDFNVADPNLNIDALVAEMNAISAPTLKNYEMPSVSELVLDDVPDLSLPGFNDGTLPDALDNPDDYAAQIENKYNQYSSDMRGLIDQKVDEWVTKFAPDYQEQRQNLNTKVIAGLQGQVLPDQFESALFNRARGRTEKEFNAAEQNVLDNDKRRGFISPPGSLRSAMNKLRIASAEANANQATDIYVKRREMEVQHLQFVMNLASSQVTGVRSFAIQYVGSQVNIIQSATSLAESITNKAVQVYEHKAKRSELMLSVLDTLNRQYESKLKAALSSLDGYKLTLEAEKAKKDAEIAQVQAVESQMRAEEIKVNLYSAMIESITRKSAVKELDLKYYSTKADVYRTRVQAQESTFGMYKSAMEGDKSKLDGELSKLQVYESQIRAVQSKLDAEKAAIDATTAYNDSKAKSFELGVDVYKAQTDAALSKFMAEAEIKKLSQAIYRDELAAEIDVHKIKTEDIARRLELIMREYETRSGVVIKKLEYNLGVFNTIQRALEVVAGSSAQMASSALNSLNTMVSSAISETA
jgi:hypothetical protein